MDFRVLRWDEWMSTCGCFANHVYTQLCCSKQMCLKVKTSSQSGISSLSAWHDSCKHCKFILTAHRHCLSTGQEQSVDMMICNLAIVNAMIAEKTMWDNVCDICIFENGYTILCVQEWIILEKINWLLDMINIQYCMGDVPLAHIFT